MNYYLQESIDPKDDDWPFQLYTKATDTNDNAVANCGTIGASCSFRPDVLMCQNMTERGYGQA